MTFLYLLLLVTQSFALQYTLPRHFGGKTGFSDRVWRMWIGQLSPEVTFGQPPTIELNIAEEPTCFLHISECSTTYFGKKLALKRPESAKLWVKWHEDSSPFACYNPYGCTVTSIRSVADLTAQSKGWRVTANIHSRAGPNNDSPSVNGEARKILSFQYSKEHVTPKTITTYRRVTSKCSHNNMCYSQTGTLMMNITGNCDSKPLIVCSRYFYVCEDLPQPWTDVCSQWDAFIRKHCQSGVHKLNIEDCSLTVAVIGENGEPITIQMFEQKPMPRKGNIVKRDYVPINSSSSELPDGSSGA